MSLQCCKLAILLVNHCVNSIVDELVLTSLVNYAVYSSKMNGGNGKYNIIIVNSGPFNVLFKIWQKVI